MNIETTHLQMIMLRDDMRRNHVLLSTVESIKDQIRSQMKAPMSRSIITNFLNNRTINPARDYILHLWYSDNDR